MESRNGYYRQNRGLWSSFRDGDFEEADVWAVIKERKNSNYSQVGQSSKEIEAPLNLQRRALPSVARMIPRTGNSKGNSSSSSNSNSNSSIDDNKGVKQQSAPVKIPDWSKISKNKSKKKANKSDSDNDSVDDHSCVDDGDEDSYDDEEDVYDCKVPPHEFIANRLAKSQISSFSVFEGVGRKLKGRDLSQVRNAVLTKTGFLEECCFNKDWIS